MCRRIDCGTPGTCGRAPPCQTDGLCARHGVADHAATVIKTTVSNDSRKFGKLYPQSAPRSKIQKLQIRQRDVSRDRLRHPGHLWTCTTVPNGWMMCTARHGRPCSDRDQGNRVKRLPQILKFLSKIGPAVENPKIADQAAGCVAGSIAAPRAPVDVPHRAKRMDYVPGTAWRTMQRP
jgi:hypothetical protein